MEVLNNTEFWLAAGAFANALAIVVAACLATRTFNSWKRQRVEDRRISVAEEALSLAYDAADALRHMRSRAEVRQSYTDRANSYNEKFSQLKSHNAKVRVYFGDKAFTAINSIYYPFDIIKTAMVARGGSTIAVLRLKNGDQNITFTDEQIENFLYARDSNDDADAIEEQIRTAIEQLEKELFPVIGRRS